MRATVFIRKENYPFHWMWHVNVSFIRHICNMYVQCRCLAQQLLALDVIFVIVHHIYRIHRLLVTHVRHTFSTCLTCSFLSKMPSENIRILKHIYSKLTSFHSQQINIHMTKFVQFDSTELKNSSVFTLGK